jgi:ABC-type multidrug transport system fused ATPase/permease subunit
LIILVNLLTQGLYVYSDFWLSSWTSAEETSIHQHHDAEVQIRTFLKGQVNLTSTTNQTLPSNISYLDYGLDYTSYNRLYIYIGILAAILIAALAHGIITISITIRASMLLHDKMYDSVSNAPILFFDSNPSGRILNRFAKDV